MKDEDSSRGHRTVCSLTRTCLAWARDDGVRVLTWSDSPDTASCECADHSGSEGAGGVDSDQARCTCVRSAVMWLAARGHNYLLPVCVY